MSGARIDTRLGWGDGTLETGNTRDLSQGALDVNGSEAGVAGGGDSQPGSASEQGETARQTGRGAGQEFAGGGFEMTGSQADGAEGAFEVLKGLGLGPEAEA